MTEVGIDPFKLYEWASGAGFPALLALILFTSYKGVWVWGHVFRAERKEKEEWKTFALNGMNLAGRAVGVAAKSVSAPSPDEGQG